jgi:hypothetical protein
MIGLGVYGLVELPHAAWVTITVGSLYVALAAFAFRAPRLRDHSTVFWATGLATATVAALDVTDGTWRVLWYGGLAAAAATIAGAARERRLLVAAGALLVLAVGRTLRVEAPLSELLAANADPADGVPAVLIVIAAAVAFARNERRDDEPEPAHDLAYALERRVPEWRAAAVGTAALGALYAVSLATLGAAMWIFAGSVEVDFQRGHTLVSAVWGLVGLALLYAGLTRRHRALRLTGFALFGVTLGKIFLYDLASLSSAARAASFLAVGGALLVGGFFYQRLSADRDTQT